MTGRQSKQLNVICVDDDPAHLKLIARAIDELSNQNGDEAISVRCFTDPADALASLPTERPVVVLMDHHLPGASGLDWVHDFLKAGAGPVIMLTSESNAQVAAAAFRAGVSDFLVKSSVIRDPLQLQTSFREAVRRFRLEQSNHDLTTRLKRANAQLEEMNHKLQTLTATAHQFVEDISHEFRTPLSVIKEFAAIIGDGLDGPVTCAQRDHLAVINDSVTDLNHLVEDFLDSSKLKVGGLRMERRRCDVKLIIERVARSLTPRVNARSITLCQQIDPQMPEIYADEEKVAHVLMNLLTNALKFCPERSKITLSAQRAGDGDAEIGVSDEGRGISPEDMQQLFRRFSQVGRTDESPIRGFGLGLHIASQLVWLNLGRMNVTSKVGAGSTFSFTLPPNDPTRILECYLQRLNERKAERGMISVLRIRPGSTDCTIDEIRRFITVACYATDLALPSTEAQGMLAVGHTRNPQAWRDRLMVSWADTCGDFDKTGMLQIECVDSWSYPLHTDRTVSGVCELVSGGRAHAEPCLGH